MLLCLDVLILHLKCKNWRVGERAPHKMTGFTLHCKCKIQTSGYNNITLTAIFFSSGHICIINLHSHHDGKESTLYAY